MLQLWEHLLDYQGLARSAALLNLEHLGVVHGLAAHQGEN
jgi:hypothetical protein